MSLAIQAFRYAAEPFFFSNASDKQSPALFAKVNHYFVIVCCILLLGVGINLDILKYFLGDSKYWEGLPIVPILLLGYLFNGVYYNLTVWFKITDRTYFATIITIIGRAYNYCGKLHSHSNSRIYGKQRGNPAMLLFHGSALLLFRSEILSHSVQCPQKPGIYPSHHRVALRNQLDRD